MEIVTVWSGGTYSLDYVESLRNQVKKYTGQELITLGYDLPLRTNWLGWCAKIELFAPWQSFRPCLYIDLDTFILSTLPRIRKPKRLTLIRDFNLPQRGNSGVMLIPDDVREIWEGGYDGKRPDGDYLDRFPHDYIQDLYPELVKSYKVDRLQNSKPDTPIMCFHGKPKPPFAEGWAKDYWYSFIENKT